MVSLLDVKHDQRRLISDLGNSIDFEQARTASGSNNDINAIEVKFWQRCQRYNKLPTDNATQQLKLVPGASNLSFAAIAGHDLPIGQVSSNLNGLAGILNDH